MAKIKKIIAREIFDSRGVPTIEGKLILDDGKEFKAAASAGVSKGKYEGVELRDGDEKRYQGLGVKKAVSYINDLIGPKLVGVDCQRHIEIDHWLVTADGTENYSRLGVNTLMVISQLGLKAAAYQENLPLYHYCQKLYDTLFKKKTNIEKLPAPIFSLINGGAHGTKNLDFQEFQVIPATYLSFSQALAQGLEIYNELKKILDYQNIGVGVGEEGGFVPNLFNNVDAFEIMKEAINRKKLKIGVDIFFGLDLSASYFYREGKYFLKDKPRPLKIDDYLEYLVKLNEDYRFLILEDPVEEEDWLGWKKVNLKLGDSAYIVADDFIGGDKKRLVRAIKEKVISGIVIKFNQTATIAEMFEIVNQAKEANLKIIFSHRFGETNDSLIADLAVGLQGDFIKFGAPVRGERVVKYNRLLEIENEI